jgi:hypothetical protein
MNISTLTAALALAAASLAGCGNKSSSGDSAVATAGTTAPGGTTAAAAGGGKGAIVATCVKKTVCTEYRNEIPMLAEDFCKGSDETFKKGSTPCPTEKLLGTCVNKLAPDATNYWYGDREDADIDKNLCVNLDGTWTAAKSAASGTGTAGVGVAAVPAPPAKAGRAAPASPAKPKTR